MTAQAAAPPASAAIARAGLMLPGGARLVTNGVCVVSKNPPCTPLVSVALGVCETLLDRLPWLALILK